MPNKNDIVTIEITDITLEGMGVGKTEEGYVLFVPGSAPGDIIKAKILKVLASYGYAKIEEIISPSRDRIEVDCPVFAKCGGCVFRHISYEKELEIKKNLVDAQFERIGGLDIRCDGITPSPEVCGYRNKAQFPVGCDEKGLYFGFFAQHSHRIIKCENCALHPAFYTDILAAIKKWGDRYKISAYSEETKQGLLRHVYIRDGRASGEIIVCLVATGNTPKTKELTSALLAANPNIVGIVLCINKKEGNEILSDNFRVLHGKGYMTDTLCGVEFDISPRSFYQVNHDGAEKLYGIAAEYAALTGSETIIDLYCGTGTIGLSMANKASRLLGIDIVEKSIECARENAAANNVENAFFVATDAGKSENIRKAAEKHGFSLSASTVIMDPPRKGSTPELLGFLAAEKVKKIVYISCNPDTLARDAATLLSLGYTMSEVTPVNMFPRTGHVESVVAFRI